MPMTNNAAPVAGPYTPKQIERIGGSPWERAGKSRVYLNDWGPMIGLQVNYYGTGNVSSVTLDGQLISNNRATRLLGGAEVYLEGGSIRTNLKRAADGAGLPVDGDELVRRLFAAIAERVAALPEE
jgi:hypothetical protein